MEKGRYKLYLLLGILIFVIAFLNRKKISKMIEHLKTIFLKFEGFTPVPLWDVKQWSWGYGTKVPGSISDKNIKPPGKITTDKAMQDSFVFVEKAAANIFPKIKVPLNDRQKAAIISFAYNLGYGTGNNDPAGKLIQDINSKDKGRIEYGFKAYNRANGVAMKQLTARRKYEFDLFYS